MEHCLVKQDFFVLCCGISEFRTAPRAFQIIREQAYGSGNIDVSEANSHVLAVIHTVRQYGRVEYDVSAPLQLALRKEEFLPIVRVPGDLATEKYNLAYALLIQPAYEGVLEKWP